MTRVILKVPDISCEHCEARVKEALRPIEGVSSVVVSIPTQEVTVDYDEQRVSLDAMKKTLANEDYPVSATR